MTLIYQFWSFMVIIPSESQLTELRDWTNPGQFNVSDAHSRTNDDNVSSVCDVPALSGGGPMEQFLVGLGEGDETTEETSQLVPVELYGYPLFASESGTEGRDEKCSDKQVPGPSKRPEKDELPDLSGRSKAILMEYFEEASPIRLPVGHNTIVFTEPQVYHVSRVLTDETLRKTFTTMERMVIDAVRGSPTLLPSRTAHLEDDHKRQ